MTIVDVKWFPGRDCIGIVLVDTGFGHKAYIGACHGFDEESDQEAIAKYGTRFHYGSLLWPDVKGWAE